MKKLLLLLLAVMPIAASSQTPENDYIIRTDTSVLTGKLPNGLTYYIKKNLASTRTVNFTLVQSTGSIVETPSERGLAHFLEHMAFNGSKHFPGSGIRDYLQRNGFSHNATTYVDWTVYNINTSKGNPFTMIDSCLLILRDWADGLLLQDSMVEKERPIIVEEWRTRSDHARRMNQGVLYKAYGSSRYADCDPIGNMDIVRNCTSEDLRTLYKKWYRPDLQAVIVVGDMDPGYVLARLQLLFDDYEAPVSAPERIWYPVEDNAEPIILFGTDKESTGGSLRFMQKHDVYPRGGKNKFSYKRQRYLKDLTDIIMNIRLSELSLSLGAPFSSAEFADDAFIFAETKDSYSIYASCNEQKFDRCFAAVFAEYEKLRRYGFTESEFEYAKKTRYAGVKSYYDLRNNQGDLVYVNQCMVHFRNGEPLISAEDDLKLISALHESITLKDLNDFVMGSDTSNIAVAFTGPESDSYKFPTKERIMFLMDSIRSAQLTPYAEEDIDRPLISKDIRKGKIKSKRQLGGIYEYELSNGTRVLFMQNKYMQGRMLMKAEGEGGMSSEPLEDAYVYPIIDVLLSVGGIGDFRAAELKKRLAGVDLSLTFNLNLYNKTISGVSTLRDFETLMQMLYLSFTAPRRDDEAILAMKERTIEDMRSRARSPEAIMADSVNKAIWGNNPYMCPTIESIEKADCGRGFKIMRRHFSRAADFTFYFTGGVGLEEFETIIEKYLASIPSKGRRSVANKNFYVLDEEPDRIRYELPMETPKTSISIDISVDAEYNIENFARLNVLNNVLYEMCFEEMRERAGGAYDVSVNGLFDKWGPYEGFEQHIGFDCNPDRTDEMLSLVRDILGYLAVEGPPQVLLDNAKVASINRYYENIWGYSTLFELVFLRDVNGINLYDFYEKVVEELTAEDIRSFAKIICEAPNYNEVVQVGVKR